MRQCISGRRLGLSWFHGLRYGPPSVWVKLRGLLPLRKGLLALGGIMRVAHTNSLATGNARTIGSPAELEPLIHAVAPSRCDWSYPDQGSARNPVEVESHAA